MTKESKSPSTDQLTPSSYPTPDSLSKLQKQRQKNLLIAGLILGILAGGTYLQLKYLELPSIGFVALLNLNLLFLIILLILILRNLIKLFMERGRSSAGHRFRTKMVVAFILMSMLPTGLLAFIGSNLMADSIQNWFNPQIDEFVDYAMELARASHANAEALADQYARTIRQFITDNGLNSEERQTELVSMLSQKQAEYQLESIQFFDKNAIERWRSSPPEETSGIFLGPESPYFENLFNGNSFFDVHFMGDGELIRRGVPIFSSIDSGSIEGALVISIYLPKGITQSIRTIQHNFEAYKQQKQMIRPTQGLYIAIFVLFAFTILFAAIWLGLYLARQISIPISHLAQAIQEVANGNLDYRLNIMAFDEIGTLVKSFNWMTEQLHTNRVLIEQSAFELQSKNKELLDRGNQLETILGNITAGVISIDTLGHVRTINIAAAHLLEITMEESLGKHFTEVLSGSHLREIKELMERIYWGRNRSFQREIQIRTHHGTATLSVSLAALLDADRQFNGVVAVFDDLTQFLRIQRIAAWREMARQLAHEIKNPLTPIQLNVQRIQKKYRQRSADFDLLFHNTMNMIINEVNGLLILLDEFSQFARMPEASLSTGNIHELLQQTISLYSGSVEGITIDVALDHELPPLMLDGDQIKRVFGNLIDNAIEAMNGNGVITIESHYDTNLQIVRIDIADNGHGIPSNDRDKVFLPYYSTKGRGSGLGLAICQRIITDHNGNIRAQDNEPRGARFIIEIPVITQKHRLEK